MGLKHPLGYFTLEHENGTGCGITGSGAGVGVGVGPTGTTGTGVGLGPGAGEGLGPGVGLTCLGLHVQEHFMGPSPFKLELYGAGFIEPSPGASCVIEKPDASLFPAHSHIH